MVKFGRHSLNDIRTLIPKKLDESIKFTRTARYYYNELSIQNYIQVPASFVHIYLNITRLEPESIHIFHITCGDLIECFIYPNSLNNFAPQNFHFHRNFFTK